jgi:hypothetical protein
MDAWDCREGIVMAMMFQTFSLSFFSSDLDHFLSFSYFISNVLHENDIVIQIEDDIGRPGANYLLKDQKSLPDHRTTQPPSSTVPHHCPLPRTRDGLPPVGS